jgi:hypothetical protein
MNEERPHPLTGAGKILFVCTLLLIGALLYAAFIGVFQRLPEGSYPAFVLLAPIGFVAVLFFFGGAWLLRSRGIATFTSEIDEVRDVYARKTEATRTRNDKDTSPHTKANDRTSPDL